jgi:putative Ca2+/H+ antiporter (TMEM165/GDT1 family)
MHAFWIATLFVFIAEMGDKTQRVSLAFASRYSAKIVLSGGVPLFSGIRGCVSCGSVDVTN